MEDQTQTTEKQPVENGILKWEMAGGGMELSRISIEQEQPTCVREPFNERSEGNHTIMD